MSLRKQQLGRPRKNWLLEAYSVLRGHEFDRIGSALCLALRVQRLSYCLTRCDAVQFGR